MSRGGIALSGGSFLAFGVIAMVSAFSPEIAYAVLPWAAAVVFILFISVLTLDALKR